MPAASIRAPATSLNRPDTVINNNMNATQGVKARKPDYDIFSKEAYEPKCKLSIKTEGSYH